MKHPCSIVLALITFISFPPVISSQACQNSCGVIPINYPFGTGPGCGDPRFQQYVTCNQGKLTLKTHTGWYPVTNIDYANQVMYISDPSMSTCSCMQSSKGFALDWDAPFSFHDNMVFTLLDCSTSSSPIFKADSYSGDNSTKVPQCDRTGAPICSFLYTCTAISMLCLPISTCCVYTPVDLGPSFEMDLQKLKCTSYSGFYSFSGQETNPENWKYGITLKYKFNVYNDYPNSCANCEKRGGVCGYDGADSSFVCNCPNGLNMTSDCYFEAPFNQGPSFLPWETTGTWLIRLLACFIVWNL